MTRIATLFAAAAALVAAPAVAATYTAKPAIQPETARIIARDISWNCGTGACLGRTQESRPAILCEGLAKRAGRLESFVADGRAFGAAELAKCNASAKAVAASVGSHRKRQLTPRPRATHAARDWAGPHLLPRSGPFSHLRSAALSPHMGSCFGNMS